MSKIELKFGKRDEHDLRSSDNINILYYQDYPNFVEDFLLSLEGIDITNIDSPELFISDDEKSQLLELVNKYNHDLEFNKKVNKLINE